MPVVDKGSHFLSYGRSTDLWAVGDALYFPNGVTDEWQMRPAIDADLPHPGLEHRPGAMVLVRRFPSTIYYQLVVVPPMRRALIASNCVWAVKRELRRNHELRRVVKDLEAGNQFRVA